MSTPSDLWTIEPDWLGETVFIVAGGTSATPDDIASLKGRKVIAINSSYHSAPFADILFFADSRWWVREREQFRFTSESFAGIIATTSKASKTSRLHRLRQVVPPPGMAMARNSVALERTSLQAAMNIAMHKGARRMVLLGADNRDGDDGRIHHHAEYPWTRHRLTWDVKKDQLGLAATDLKKMGVEVLNCSNITTLDFWPTPRLSDVLGRGDL